MSHRRLNDLTGWTVFIISLTVYLLTMAPTASFWDCGEFIACANELEVSHPPGAPLYLLLGRMFAIFSFGSSTHTAYMINLMSALCSGFTAMFICWITVRLAQKGLQKANWQEEMKQRASLLAGLIAGLSSAFTDSFWFNAVEAEVYAMSSFFTALVVWLMFKWEARADERDHLRWIVLIAYLMGLSTGVHLLNLLTIPALALLYFYKKFNFSWLGFIATLSISLLILLLIQYGIIQETFSIAKDFELIFTGALNDQGEVVRGWGMPVGSGSLILTLLLMALLSLFIFISHRKKWMVLHLSLLSLGMILIGFSSYTLVFIRSNADPPIDMNNPENVLTFLSYMKREQYGERPLWRGPLYNGKIKRDAEGRLLTEVKGMKYLLLQGKERYVEDVADEDYIYQEEDVVILPRMWSPNRYNSGAFGYVNYVGDKGNDPQSPYDDKPTRLEDLRFFLDYQLDHMYLRYFMWNFVGRSSDEQDLGWEDGLLRSSSYFADNKANNHYYFLPLIMGLLGLLWHLSFQRRDATVVGLLFLLMGVAIIIYLNQYPAQPRERDYSFVGSFQTFAIWIGLGVLFWIELLRKYLGKASLWVGTGLALLSPILLLSQNWDDHSRRGRWIDVEFAKNLLDSCAPDAILFTGGDNDTFPLWYVQEVEGYRTDVRIVNLELLISDWYIDQIRQAKNGALPVPIQMESEQYAGEKDILISNYPPRLIILAAIQDSLKKYDVLNDEELSWMGNRQEMNWRFRPRGSTSNPYILRKDSVLIDIVRNVAEAGWKRPLYFSNTLGSSSYLNLDDFLRMEGLAARLVPLRRSNQTPNDIYTGWIARERMEKALREKFVYTGLDDPGIYFDEHIRERILGNYRQSAFRLMYTYAEEVSQWKEEIQEVYQEADSLSVSQDSIRLRIREKQSKIGLAQDKIRQILAWEAEKMPTSVIPKSSIQQITTFQVMMKADMEQEGESYLEDITEKALKKLQALKADGVMPGERNPELQIIVLGLQYYMENNTQKGINLDQRLSKIMGQGLLRRKQ